MTDTFDQEFKDQDFTNKPLKKGNYEECVFSNCNFSNSDLSDIIFIDCRFQDCDMTNAKLVDSSFRETSFEGCKMVGLQFEHCKTMIFSVSFKNCQLDLSSFYQMPLKGTAFQNCEMKEVDLAEADLTKAAFTDCNLKNATFDRTNLEGADLRTAQNFQIDPDVNQVKGARFSLDGLPGLLGKYKIKIG